VAGYSLIWVTDLGYAGMDHGRSYPTAEAAMADATPGVTWTREGRAWVSTRSRFGDIFHVRPVRQ
jgi:hypothetical protein